MREREREQGGRGKRGDAVESAAFMASWPSPWRCHEAGQGGGHASERVDGERERPSEGGGSGGTHSIFSNFLITSALSYNIK